MEFIDDLQMQLAENLSEEIHCHSCYEIIWAVCGEGIYRDEADYFPFPENRILVVNPFKNHAVLMEKGSAAIQLYLPGRFFSEKLQKELPSFGCLLLVMIRFPILISRLNPFFLFLFTRYCFIS